MIAKGIFNSNIKPTKKQLDFIADMKDCGCGKFTGTTRREASEYISKNIDLYKLYSQDSWHLDKGYF